jgi:eukaryotic-like serine/threonine-protein kinase
VPVSPAQDMIRFGLFELDLKAGQLTRNGSKLRLPQQPLQLLAVLLERPGEILTREELRQRLWPSDVFVDFDHGLNKSVQKLRDVLGDSATSPRYIETIPRVGYRFIAPVRNGTRPPEFGPVTEIPHQPAEATVPATAMVGSPRTRWWALIAAVCATCAIIAAYHFARPHAPVLKYTQLTDFTDSAIAPALSPDGHILAFIRGDSSFMSADQIYVKMLPHGEARRLTNDARFKYNLAFSPDGSQIAYTVLETPSFATYTVSVLGSDLHRLLGNAAGLTWLDPQHFLFSRIRSGLHLGVVTASVTGDNFRELYYPPHQRGMAHYSYASPDRQSALVVEMNGEGNWDLCKLISLSGSSPARPIGPQGACTSAGWSPDGSWMYFIAIVDGQSHLWRQRFPNGEPEQVTFGPAEEEGLAVEPHGRSVITSIGVRQSSIWIHDANGERSLSSEGEIVGRTPPSFSPDDKNLYYLLYRQSAAPGPELWRMSLDSGKSETVLPGISMFSYDVSPDGKQVAYSSRAHDGKSQLWLAATDRSSPAKQIGESGDISPYFGPQGQIIFQRAEGSLNYLEQMNQDGSRRAKVIPDPIIEIMGVSPGRKWLVAMVSHPDDGGKRIPMVMAVPLDGGPIRRLCASYCVPRWSSSGKFLFIPVEAESLTNPGRSLAIPVGPGESLPAFPPGGIEPLAQPDVIPGAQSVDREDLVPGADLSHFAYVKTTAHRNLYRISLP